MICLAPARHHSPRAPLFWRRLILPLTISSMGALTACAGQGTTKTGFIAPETYGMMVHPKGHSDDLVYAAPVSPGERYQYVMIDHAQWHPSAKAPHLTLKAEARVTQAFDEELHKILAKDFTILPPETLSPPPGTLRIQAAITNLRRSKWYYNALPIVAGFAAGAAGGGLPPIPPPAPGGASEELVAIDASNGRTLMAIATYNNGMPWNMMGQWLPYAHARRAFHLAAALMDEQLHQTGIAPSPIPG
ncbi:DUF3313 domain-containing protein [Asaia krungthepensis]|uniref:DUF3313 domain-containing protein n=1 Tax=Asaia krungthepensis NRIC 0535 TaxID=1307925 RepID=A0ABQ0Q065_9PROT|nr:DUF3313 domain-containing protein [Asaia krungthepensis]GBQ85884.1 hypothetical protein AA0535_0885 [Asaia krungthepensis NRIC 0535]